MSSSHVRVILGGIAIAVALAVGATLHLRRGKAEPASVVRDVPRLEGSAVVFSPAFRDRAGITFAKADRVPFKPTVRVVGTVALNPSYVAAIGTRLRGTVRRTFKFEGDRIEANEALGEVESGELGEAQAGIAQAEASLEVAELHAKREGELLQKSLTTARENEIAQGELTTTKAAVRAAQNRVRALGGGGGFGVYVLRSPIAGHVVARHISPGQSVDGAMVGYQIADLAHLWIELTVFERDLPHVHVDDDVDVRPLNDPTARIPGKVAHVGQLIDPATRSTAVRIAVDHPKVHLRPGQSVEAVITSGNAPREAVLVPHASVVYVDGKATVFVAESDTRVRAVPVRLGASDGTHHEVLEGVDAGQSVACGGVFAFKSELFR